MKRRMFLHAALICGGSLALAVAAVHVLDCRAGQRPAARPACCCGTLRDYRELPYAKETGTGTCTLLLALDRLAPSTFCFSCSGSPARALRREPATMRVRFAGSLVRRSSISNSMGR